MTDAEKENLAGETVPTVLEAFKAKLAMSDEDFKSKTSSHVKKLFQKTGIKVNLFMPIRIAVSGEMRSDSRYYLPSWCKKSIEHIENSLTA